MKKLISILLIFLFAACSKLQPQHKKTVATAPNPAIVSEAGGADYQSSFGKHHTVVNGNMPKFTKADIAKGMNQSFEEYSRLDRLGRCGRAFARVGEDVMPVEKRKPIGKIKPTGWQYTKYSFVDGKYLYNRCHLIGYQLAGENANPLNLITCTRYMNVKGMLPFENQVSEYVRKTGNHVLYRVTPVFKENNLVADGALMEAWSLEDNGRLHFNVFVHNIQPGVAINYTDGTSQQE